MYNEDIKKRYIEEKEGTTSTPNDYLPRMFNKTESFEERLEKDVSCFTTYEIVDFYKTLSISSYESLKVLNSHLSLYTEWCLKQNLVPDCQNHYCEITNETLLKYINVFALKKSIIDRKTLYNWLDQLKNPSDAFIMIALFEGIKGKEFCEIAQLTIDDFDGNTVRLCTGRTLTVSDKLVELAKESYETLEYYAVDGERVIKLNDDNLIIKNYPNCQDNVDDFYVGRRIYRKLLRNFESLGVSKWMKPNALVESGKIYYINTLCKKLGISVKEFFSGNYSEYKKELEYRFEYNFTRKKLDFCRKYDEYLI